LERHLKDRYGELADEEIGAASDSLWQSLGEEE
jgi:hypothetical protein